MRCCTARTLTTFPRHPYFAAPTLPDIYVPLPRTLPALPVLFATIPFWYSTMTPTCAISPVLLLHTYLH